MYVSKTSAFLPQNASVVNFQVHMSEVYMRVVVRLKLRTMYCTHELVARVVSAGSIAAARLFSLSF